jgi:hypothetical protein
MRFFKWLYLGYHNEGTNIPGWGGYYPAWQQASFDLSEWANQSIRLRIAFGSDPAWCSYDNPSYFGLVVDNLTIVTDGDTIYYDDAEMTKTLLGVINYFDTEHTIWGITSLCLETPIPIPETGEYVYANLFFNCSSILGDVNSDYQIDILDLVRVVNICLSIGDQPTDYELWASDLNYDDNINILDIVILVNIILES